MKRMEAGKIVNTHGIRGEVKIQPWCDSAEFLCKFDVYYINETPYRVLASRPHKGCVLAKLEGVSDINAAMCLKNKVISVDREGITLPEGQYFISDLLGLSVVTVDGETIGTIKDVLNLPANDVYVVQGETEYMIPVVKEFVQSVDLVAKCVTVKLIPGMETERSAPREN